MKILRILLMLFTAQLVVPTALPEELRWTRPAVQATWVEARWLKGKENVAIGSAEHIWSASMKENSSGKYDFVLEKWNHATKKWDTKVSNTRDSGKLTGMAAAGDGSVFVLFHQDTQEFEAFKEARSKRYAQALIQALKKSGKDDLAAEFDGLIKKFGYEGGFFSFFFGSNKEKHAIVSNVFDAVKAEDTKLFGKYEGKTEEDRLYRFADNKFEKLVDVSMQDGQIELLGAVNKQAAWFTRTQEGKCSESNVCEKWLEKFDGTILTRVNLPKQSEFEILLGADGTLYFDEGGAPREEGAPEHWLLSKLVGSTWQEVKNLPAMAPNNAAIVSDKEMWLAPVSDPLATKIFYWNGKTLQEKGSLNGVVSTMKVAPQSVYSGDEAGRATRVFPRLVLVQIDGDKWYQWGEEERMWTNPVIGVKPVMPAPKIGTIKKK